MPHPVRRWQQAVHRPGVYDLEVDTTDATARECAARIEHRLFDGPPASALVRLRSG